jgi:hypothetical protein
VSQRQVEMGTEVTVGCESSEQAARVQQRQVEMGTEVTVKEGGDGYRGYCRL